MAIHVMSNVKIPLIYYVGTRWMIHNSQLFMNLTRVSVSTMTYCVVQINCLPLPRFFKEVTMKTAEERYEETWNSYLELLNKDPRASLVSFTKL